MVTADSKSMLSFKIYEKFEDLQILKNLHIKNLHN